MKNKNIVLTNLFWKFAERTGNQMVQFIVSIVLARILAPETYGTIALVMVFIQILQVFVDSGLGNALIQKKDTDDLDFSTVFFFNIGMCVILYICMYNIAPLIGTFYNSQDLVSIIRVISLLLIISGVKNIQQAYVSKNMLFKRFFFSTLGGTIISAIIGITLAYLGIGIWSLVAQQLSSAIIDTTILWITVKWKPKMMFSWKRFGTLFSFGWKLLISSLLDTIYNNVRNLIIGKKYSPSDLAYYNNGQKIPNLVVTNINTSISSVLLPVLAGEQHDPSLIKAHTRRAIQVSSYLMWPVMLGLFACAKPLILLLLTEKWVSAIPYLQIACFVYGLMPIHTANLQAIMAMGRSDLFLKQEILKKIIGIIILLISMQFGIIAIASSAILIGIISSFINAYPNRYLLNYKYIEQVHDITPPFLLSVFMAIILILLGNLQMTIFLLLPLQFLVGIIIYFLGSKYLKIEGYKFCLSYLKKFFQHLM